MTLILTGLTVTATAILLVPLALIAIGIRRQERSGSLAAPVPGLAPALARTLIDLRAAPEPRPAPTRAPLARQARP